MRFEIKFKLIYPLFFFLLSIILLQCITPSTAKSEAVDPQILLINSYHEGYDWSDDETDGFRTAILKSFPQSVIYTEFLDTKNFPKQDHFLRFADLMESKYGKLHFDVIVVMDNAALDFITKYRKRLFNDTPVVFCGINYFKPSMLSGQSNITGAAEIQDSIGTLNMALELHPKTNEVIVVHDYTITGLSLRQEMENGLGTLPNTKVSFLEDMRLDQAINVMKKLRPDQLVLILSYAVEKGGRSFTQAEAARIITSSSPVPVYAIHAAQLGHGIIGGKLLSGKAQGQKAGELAIRIIKGTSADDLPVYTGYLSENMFDYSILKKFNVNMDKLPKDTIIINKPSSNYAVNKTAFWFIILFSSATTIILIAFFRNIQQRKSFEKTFKLSEAKFRQLFNNAGDAIYIINGEGDILEVNQAACDKMGYTHTEFLSLPYHLVLADSQSTELHRKIEKVKLYRQLLFESVHITRNNITIPVEVSSTVIDFEDKTAFLNIVRDISERKKAEEEIHLQTRLLEQEVAEHRQTEQLLRTERNNLNVIFESAPVGMALLNKESQLISFNKIMSGLFQLDQSQITRQRLGDILQCPKSFKSSEGCGGPQSCSDCPINKAISQALQVGLPLHGEEIQLKFVQDKELKTLWIRFSVEPITLEGQKHAVIAFEDITGKKLLAEKFRENEAHLRLILETSQSGIILISPDKRVEYANNRIAEMFGYSTDEMIGTLYTDLLNQTERELASSRLQKLIDGSLQEYHTERNYLRKNGTVFGGYYAARRLVRENGTLQAIVASITDINDITVAADNLRAEKEQLAVTLRSIGDGVITTDTEGRVVLINQVAEKLTGWSHEEAGGAKLEEVFRIIDETSRKELINPVMESLNTGRVVEISNHTILISKDGTERAIADSAAPILNKANRIIGVVLVFRDVSEKKHIEEELFKARKLESIGVLAGGIAHDFNNFLTAILGNISLARRLTTPSDRIYEILENAETASNQAKGLTQQLLTFSKGGTPIRKLASIGKIIAESASFVLRGSNVSYQLEIDPNLYLAEVDAGQMTQVFNNLIINADQSMPNGGQIKISASNTIYSVSVDQANPDKTAIKISISDQGCGISTEHLDRIFDPYFTTKKQGSGLGLATVYSIIRNHFGEITAVSKDGEGTTFSILLPAKKYSEPDSAHFEPVDSHQGNGSILIMDDEKIVCDVLTNILEHFGYEVESCSEGREASQLYEKTFKNNRPYDVVIMDITIPGGIGGKEAITMLKKIDPNVCAIVSSGYANDPIMAHFSDYGFAATLSKPYNIAEIEHVLNKVIRRNIVIPIPDQG